MFKLRFFGSFRAQREDLLVAADFAPIPLHPAVQAQLNALTGSINAPPIDVTRPITLFMLLIRGVRGLIIEIITWNAIAAIVVLCSVMVTRELVNAKSSLSVALLLAVAYLILRVGQASIDYGNNLRRLQVHRGVQVSLYRLINDKVLRLDPTSEQFVNKGQLKTLVGSDVESIEDFISAALHQWTPAIVSVLILVPALLVVSGWIGLVAFIAAIALIPVATLGARFIEHYQKKVQASQDSLTTLVGEWVKNIRLVRFLGWPAAIEGEVVERMKTTLILGALRHAVVILVYATSFSWSMVPLLVIFGISSFSATPLGIAEVFSTFWILDHLLTQIQYIPHSISMYGAAAAGAERMIKLLSAPDLERNIKPLRGAAQVDCVELKSISLRDVSVNYGEVRALSNVSLVFDLTQSTAIVGAVGSGKTTLVELLMGERYPSSGEIAVDFKDGGGPLWREDIYAGYRSCVAYSPQQPFLSNGAMRLNLDLSGESAREDIEAATIASQLKPDILLLPQMYEEEIGESGINLSGGQRQRVSLARAFLSKRKVLVLDDPLSAVDTKTESALMDSILKIGGGLILVSHRLDQLSRCDRVIVLDGGRVVEDGSPLQLSRSSESRFSSFLRAVEDHGN
jgi:ABC-type multidrug transport system fused ATPase/permease subunit